MPILIGLLVVAFAIAADLAHEAWTTALSQQDISERAERDFVRFAATSASYEARATIDLGRRALFTTISAGGVGSTRRPMSGPEVLERGAARIRECRCAPAYTPSYYFRVGLVDGELRTSGGAPPVEAERRWLRDTIIARVRAVRRADGDAALVYGEVNRRPRIIAYALRADASGVIGYAFGFVRDVASFGDAAFGPAAQTPLRADAELTPRAAR